MASEDKKEIDCQTIIFMYINLSIRISLTKLETFITRCDEKLLRINLMINPINKCHKDMA
jgi:hypothetical protein